MIHYTAIREYLKIGASATFDDKHALFTHYLQSIDPATARIYWELSKDIIEGSEDMGMIKFLEPGQGYLPIEWDIPFPAPKRPRFSFIDLFAGIGGFRLAFQNLGGKCSFTSEWNEYSKKTYEANFGEVPFGDITQIDENSIPEHDILLGGFPCQPFSIAGVTKKNALGRAHGFLDQTQGTLFFDIARIIKAKQPKAILLENVKNLVSHDKKKTFEIIVNTLESLGYKVFSQVLDGKYLVPQHRERIFIVGFLKEHFGASPDFSFPQFFNPPPAIRGILEENVNPKYTLSDKLWGYLKSYAEKHRAKGNGFGFGMLDLDGISRTISARYYKDGSEILVPQEGQNPRRLTPRECARLQGYPDSFLIPVSDNQAYRQFGNSVVVPLVQSVGERLISTMMNSHAEHSLPCNTISA